MLGIGFLEILVIAVVALVALGPKHLPQALRKIALFYKQFQNLRSELNKEIITISHMAEVKDERLQRTDAPTPMIKDEASHG